MADANILQGAIFHEDAMEDTECSEVVESDQVGQQKGNGENRWNPLESKTKKQKPKPKPAAHRVCGYSSCNLLKYV